MDWDRPPRVVAHRGASAVAPENTLAAFRAALEAGAKAVELDVHLTADGVPVVLHDETLERTTSATGPVVETTLAELKRADAGAWFDPRFRGERVPTLAESFDLLGAHALLDVELKTLTHAYRGLVGAVAEEVRARGLRESVMVSSFNPDTVREAREAGLRAALILAAAPTDEDIEAWRDAEAFVVWEGSLSARAVARIHRAGRRVYAWTVDDPVRAAALWQDGVDGVVTNDPAALLQL